MLKILLSLLSGPLSQISSDLKEAYQSKLAASNDKERIAADERITLLEAQKTTILAAQSDPYERWIRILIAFPFVVYLNKCIVWDKILGYGVTDDLSLNFWNMFYIVLGGYFLNTAVKAYRR